jgi:hypothetical protein
MAIISRIERVGYLWLVIRNPRLAFICLDGGFHISMQSLFYKHLRTLSERALCSSWNA